MAVVDWERPRGCVCWGLDTGRGGDTVRLKKDWALSKIGIGVVVHVAHVVYSAQSHT